MILKNGFTIKIAQDRCLNQRHYMVACNHCVSNCPSDAIFIKNSQVYLLKEQCSGCGLCLSDCPTQVFSSGQWDETNIVKNVQHHQWETTEFFCGAHQSQYKINKDEGTGAVQLPACLSSVSRGTWYELGLKTELDIHVDQCENCPMRATLSRLEYNLSVAAEWLESCGHQPEINFITETKKQHKKKSLRAVQVGLKATLRRDFFLSLVDFAQDATMNMYAEHSKRTFLESCLPDWWNRFAESYPQNITEESYSTYWPVIRVNDQCVSCGICRDFCPSKTLDIVEQDGNWTLRFTNGRCLDCRICQMICPMQAITRERELVSEPFELKEILSLSVMECKRCGDMVPQKNGEYCHWCEKERAQETDLNQLCKNLFLSSRNHVGD